MYFLDYSGLFSDYPSIAKQVFTFNIDVIEGSPENTIYDERIGVTVLHVFKPKLCIRNAQFAQGVDDPPEADVKVKP